MAVRKARKKKPAKRSVKRKARKTTRKTVRKKKGTVKVLNAWGNLAANKKAHWAAYRELHAQVQKAWKKFKIDAENQAYPKLIEDQQRLLLLMGECNYMLQECMRLRDKRSHS